MKSIDIKDDARLLERARKFSKKAECDKCRVLWEINFNDLIISDNRYSDVAIKCNNCGETNVVYGVGHFTHLLRSGYKVKQEEEEKTERVRSFFDDLRSISVCDFIDIFSITK